MRCRREAERAGNVEFTLRIQGGDSSRLQKKKKKKKKKRKKERKKETNKQTKEAERGRVRQKLYRKRNDSLFFVGWGGVDFKIKIFLFGGFHKAEFRDEGGKFHLC